MDELHWDVDAMIAYLREESARRLARAAVLVVSQHQKNLSIANPAPHDNPAPRGSFPRGRTFFLRANVGFMPHSLAEIAARGSVSVGVFEPAKYGMHLKDRGWKGVSDSYDQVRPEVVRILTGSHL